MKTRNCLEPVMAFLVFSLLTSCAELKKMSLSCPEPVSKYPSKTAVHHYRKAKEFAVFFQKDNKRHSPSLRYKSSLQSAKSTKHAQNTEIKQIPSPAERNTGDNTEYTDNLYAKIDKSVIPVDGANSSILIFEDEVPDFGSGETVYERQEIIVKVYSDYIVPDLKYSGILLSPSPRQSVINQIQDTMYLKDGRKVTGKLVGRSRKEYTLQTSDGMVFVFASDYVEKIVVANTKLTGTEAPDSLGQKERRMIIPYGLIAGIAGIPFSIAGFVTLKGFFWLGPLLGVLAIILSSVSLRIIRRNPDKFYGKKPAIVGLIIGFAGVVLAGILVLVMIAGLA